jgi:CDP-diacylglycerol--glycerol-3-phosphate 3-phosphatidyltransferase
MAILVISREFAVTGLRSIAAASGITIKASDLGKTKMLAQVIATSLLMLGIHNQEIRPYAMFWMWGVVLVGVASAIQYFLKFWRELDLDIKMRRRQELLELEREQRASKAAQRKAASVSSSSD